MGQNLEMPSQQLVGQKHFLSKLYQQQEDQIHLTSYQLPKDQMYSQSRPSQRQVDQMSSDYPKPTLLQMD